MKWPVLFPLFLNDLGGELIDIIRQQTDTVDLLIKSKGSEPGLNLERSAQHRP